MAVRCRRARCDGGRACAHSRRSALNVWAALCFAALAPLLLGSVDPQPLRPLAGRARRRRARGARVRTARLGHALLGLGVAAKLYPGVSCRSAWRYMWKRAGGGRRSSVSALVAGVVAARLPPVLHPVARRRLAQPQRPARRPLQVESLGAALLLVGHHVFGLGVDGRDEPRLAEHRRHAPGTGGRRRDRRPGGVLCLASGSAFARGPAEREALVRYAAAASVAFVAFGKVLSPQFLIWLIPLVPLVRGRRGLARERAARAALVLTQIWFPYRYFGLALDFESRAVVARARARPRAASRSWRRSSGSPARLPATGHAHRLRSCRAAVRAALDEDALDPHVARCRSRSAPACRCASR